MNVAVNLIHMTPINGDNIFAKKLKGIASSSLFPVIYLHKSTEDQ